MENIKLRQLAIEFCDKHTYANEDDIYNFLEENQWKIYADYDKISHRQMVVLTLESRDFKVNEIPDKLIDLIVERFEDILYDDNDNHFENCLRFAIDDFGGDLQEYAVED